MEDIIGRVVVAFFLAFFVDLWSTLVGGGGAVIIPFLLFLAAFAGIGGALGSFLMCTFFTTGLRFCRLPRCGRSRGLQARSKSCSSRIV